MLPVLLAFTLMHPQTETFDSAARVREAIERVKPEAFMASTVDWAAIEAEMLAQSEGAKDTADMLPAYQTLVERLGDGHSFIQVPAEVQSDWEARHGKARYRPDIPERPRPVTTFGNRGEVEFKDLPVGSKSARLLNVPLYEGNASSDRARAFADTLFNTIADAPTNTCGYMLDLRGNPGGNLWPMLVGVSGLLGDSEQGLFKNADGSVDRFARLEGGKAIVNEGEYTGHIMASAPAWRHIDGLDTAPVAVITDNSTASSGEGVVIAFIGRPSTRSFGARTYGVASSNSGYTQNDGVNFVITTAMIMDRNEQVYPHGISPDEEVDASGDEPVQAAARWMATLPACQ